MSLPNLPVIGFLLVLIGVGPAHGSVSMVSSQSVFSASGVITQNTNWDTNGPDFTAPGSPYAVGDLSFDAGGFTLIGGTARFGFDRSLMLDDQGTLIRVAGVHDLFAFNLGNVFGEDLAVVDLTTNLRRYVFTPAVSKYADGGKLTFVGFKASSGEYFTSINYMGGGVPGSTDIQIGVRPAAAPEPTAWAMAVSGLGVVGAMLRRRRYVPTLRDRTIGRRAETMQNAGRRLTSHPGEKRKCFSSSPRIDCMWS